MAKDVEVHAPSVEKIVARLKPGNIGEIVAVLRGQTPARPHGKPLCGG